MTNKALVLRVCDKDGKSRNGFQWPLIVGAEVKAPDWKANKECGNGLHGWLYGKGELCCDYWKQPDAQWLVVEVYLPSVVMLGGKCKFPYCVVRFVGGRKEATDYLYEHEERSRTVAVIGALRGDLTQGANVFVGPLGTATAGYRGTATAGDSGTATAGDRGTATAGDMGTATAGDSGTATAGDSGTATAGDSGTATAGYRGTATAGEAGVITIEWHDGQKNRRSIAAVGQNGIKANTPYKLDDEGNFIEVTK